LNKKPGVIQIRGKSATSQFRIFVFVRRLLNTKQYFFLQFRMGKILAFHVWGREQTEGACRRVLRRPLGSRKIK
jgi:hypothetical protein